MGLLQTFYISTKHLKPTIYSASWKLPERTNATCETSVILLWAETYFRFYSAAGARMLQLCVAHNKKLIKAWWVFGGHKPNRTCRFETSPKSHCCEKGCWAVLDNIIHSVYIIVHPYYHNQRVSSLVLLWFFPGVGGCQLIITDAIANLNLSLRVSRFVVKLANTR